MRLDALDEKLQPTKSVHPEKPKTPKESPPKAPNAQVHESSGVFACSQVIPYPRE